MRIIISNLFFGGMTGSEISTYELSSELVKMGHKVYVISYQPPKPFLAEKAKKNGVVSAHWETANLNWNPDILICGQPIIAKYTINMYKGTPAIEFVRSEFQEIEAPLKNKAIKYYICNRPSVQQKIIKLHNIPPKKTKIVYNGVDFSRFRMDPPNTNNNPKRILYVGGANHLRIPSMADIVERAKKDNKIVRFVGAEKLDFMHQPHVEHGVGGWNIENQIAQCDETAGILLGRTTIEGLVAGRPGWVYNVDWTGKIHSLNFIKVPEDISIFDIKVHAQKVDEILETVLNE